MTTQDVTTAEAECVTPEQLIALFNGPNGVALLKALHKAARFPARDCGIAPDDLVQEAVLRALDGRRLCPREVELLPFLIMVMRSIASVVRTRRKNRQEAAFVPVDPDLAACDRPSPEREAISRLDGAQAIAKLRAELRQDSALEQLLEALLDDKRGEALQAALGLTENELATQRRRLRRFLARYRNLMLPV